MRDRGGRTLAPALVLGATGVLLVVAVVATVVWSLGALRWASSQTSVLANAGVWFVGLTVGTVVLSLFLAHVLARLRGGGALAALLLIPSGLTLSVVAVAWRFAFAFRPSGRGQLGIVNAVVDTAGVAPVAWLTQQPLVNTVVLTAAGVWALTGLAVAVLLAAIRRIPPDRMDVAVGSGAGEWTLLRRVVLPSIALPLVGVTAAVALVAIRMYDIVQVATGARFGTAVAATESFDRSFVVDQTARGSAMALVMLAGSLVVVALVAWWRVRRGPEADVVEPVPRHRAEGRSGRHSSTVDDADTASGGRVGRVVARVVAVMIVLVWMVPALGVAITAVRPGDLAESSGWWTVLQDPVLTVENLRTVLADGMWSGVVASLLLGVTVASVAVLIARLTAPSLAARRTATWVWVVLATIPASAILLPAHDLLDLVGMESTLPAGWLAHLLLAVPVAVLVVAAGSRPAGPGAPAALAAAGLVVFLLVWGDLLVSTTFLAGSSSAPATVRLAGLVGQRGEEQHLVAAAAVVTMVVPLVVLLAARSLLLRALVGDAAASAPDRRAGVGVEEVEPVGVDGEGGVLAEADRGVGVELGDAHGGVGVADLVEGVGVAGDRGRGIDREVDEDLGPE